MADLEFHIVVYDEGSRAKQLHAAEVSFRLADATPHQLEVMRAYTSVLLNRIEEAMGIIKHGTGEVISDFPPPDPNQLLPHPKRSQRLAAAIEEDEEDHDS